MAFDTNIITTARGPQGPPGPPGSSDATAFLGTPLDLNTMGSPENGTVLGFDVSVGKWVAYPIDRYHTPIDVGTF